MAQHEKVVEYLVGGEKGILLLHGHPGTGKTTYIRYLTSMVGRKKFIFVPSEIAPSIVDPGFMNFLMNEQGAVLVIEDAEQVMRQREKGSGGAVSVLLNLCDGLLSDVLGIQTICTFNCSVEEIDEALLRKGRLIANMKFGPLPAEKATTLATIIGKPKTYLQPTNVAEIYNPENI